MRYFKATDGTQTVFRASATRDYKFALVATGYFSGRPMGTTPGFFPVTEITRAEYARLVALKTARLTRAKGAVHYTTAG